MVRSNEEVHDIILQALRRVEDKVDKQGEELAKLTVKVRLGGAILGGVFGTVSALFVSLISRG